MPNLLTTASMLMCPHGGTVQIISSNTRVTAGGDFLARSSDTFIIAGCPFVIPPVGPPSPCVQVQWVQTALESQTMGDFNLTEESVGLCLAATQAPQGTVLISMTQPQVAGT
jgi:hypothetical protein